MVRGAGRDNQEIVASLQREIEALNGENVKMQDRLAGVLNSLQRSIRDIETLSGENSRAKDRIAGLERQIDSMPTSFEPDATMKHNIVRERVDSVFTNLTQDMVSFEEKIWLQPTRLESVPRFIPISERPKNKHGLSTRIISLINFKGGVGKTTLCGNLAASFAAGLYRLSSNTYGKPLRTLVVDLDFQGTLSERCIESYELKSASDAKLTATRLLESPDIPLTELAQPIKEPREMRVIPAHDALDIRDTECLVRLVLRLSDVRYYHRLWFHRPEVFKDFDLIIFDCPPRKTASSICALAASDYVFIPTAPDAFENMPISRTCFWLMRLRESMDLSLQIGGLLLNRTNRDRDLTVKEKQFINQNEQALGTSGEPVVRRYFASCPPIRFMKTHIPRRFGDANNINGKIGDPLPGASYNEKLDSVYRLASDIYERIYHG